MTSSCKPTSLRCASGSKTLPGSGEEIACQKEKPEDLDCQALNCHQDDKQLQADIAALRERIQDCKQAGKVQAAQRAQMRRVVEAKAKKAAVAVEGGPAFIP